MSLGNSATAAIVLALAHPFLPLDGMLRCRRSLASWPRYLDRQLLRQLLEQRRAASTLAYGVCSMPGCQQDRILLLSGQGGLRWHPYCGLHRRLCCRLGRRGPG